VAAERGRRLSAATDCESSPERYVAERVSLSVTARLRYASRPTHDAVLPPALRQLLDETDLATREAAWSDLVAQHTRLLLNVARKVLHEHDGAMDAYAHMLERLRQDDYRRLRAYEADGRSQFSTWLVVVAQRLTHDFCRLRYGRVRGSAGDSAAKEHAARQRLVDLAADAIDFAAIAQDDSASPDRDVREQQLLEKLQCALTSLTPDERLLLRLRFDDGLTRREVAHVMQLRSQFYARDWERDILGRLRAALGSTGVEDASP